MPPQSQFSLHDAAIINIVDKRKTKKVKVKMRKKDICKGVIDFGFVKDCKRRTTIFKPEKMQEDFSFIRREVIGKMILEPIFGGGSKKKGRKGRGSRHR